MRLSVQPLLASGRSAPRPREGAADRPLGLPPSHVDSHIRPAVLPPPTRRAAVTPKARAPRLPQQTPIPPEPTQLEGHRSCITQEAGPHAPVKEVVAANHPEKASGVGDRVEPVVHLLELLVHDVSGFTLGLAAGTRPVGRQQRKVLSAAGLLQGPVQGSSVARLLPNPLTLPLSPFCSPQSSCSCPALPPGCKPSSGRDCTGAQAAPPASSLCPAWTGCGIAPC